MFYVIDVEKNGVLQPPFFSLFFNKLLTFSNRYAIIKM